MKGMSFSLKQINSLLTLLSNELLNLTELEISLIASSSRKDLY